MWQIGREVIDAINNTDDLNFQFPGVDDIAKLNEIAAGFASKSQGRLFEHCIGAVDGVHFKALNSGKNTGNFVPRKNYTAILAQAICNAKREFTYVSIKKEARSHDSTAWACSDLGARFNEGAYSDRGYYLVGDNAYALASNMIVPTGMYHQHGSIALIIPPSGENTYLVHSFSGVACQWEATKTSISFTVKFASISNVPSECSLRDGGSYGPRLTVARTLALP